LGEQTDPVKQNFREESSNEGQDEHESRQRDVGQLIQVSQTARNWANRFTESIKISRKEPPMKVKTNTKAGNALWGS
jgi:hypothetical protein